MFDNDQIQEEANRFFEWPTDNRTSVTTTSAILFAQHVAKMATEELRAAILETIEENLHLADGDDCTLIRLKRAIGYDV